MPGDEWAVSSLTSLRIRNSARLFSSFSCRKIHLGEERRKPGPRETWLRVFSAACWLRDLAQWTSLGCRVQRGASGTVIGFFREAVVRIKWTNSCKMFITVISKCGMRIYYYCCVEGWITIRLFGGQGIRETLVWWRILLHQYLLLSYLSCIERTSSTQSYKIILLYFNLVFYGFIFHV